MVRSLPGNDWGWPKKVKPEQAAELWSVYEKIFYQILPEAVKKYHPEITYWPSSPQAENNQNSNPTSGDEHDWHLSPLSIRGALGAGGFTGFLPGLPPSAAPGTAAPPR